MEKILCHQVVATHGPKWQYCSKWLTDAVHFVPCKLDFNDPVSFFPLTKNVLIKGMSSYNGLPDAVVLFSYGN
jgi:hypothetical protein